MKIAELMEHNANEYVHSELLYGISMSSGRVKAGVWWSVVGVCKINWGKPQPSRLSANHSAWSHRRSLAWMLCRQTQLVHQCNERPSEHHREGLLIIIMMIIINIISRYAYMNIYMDIWRCDFISRASVNDNINNINNCPFHCIPMIIN